MIKRPIVWEDDGMLRLFIGLILVLLMFATNPVAAAPTNQGTFLGAKKTAVVFLGEPIFRGKQFYKLTTEKLTPRFTTLVVGDEPQGLYKKFWNDKGLLQEPEPKKQDLTVFSKTAPYDQVLFVLISKPVVTSTSIPYAYFIDAILYSGVNNYDQATVTFRALLIDVQSTDILSDKETTQTGWNSDVGLISSLRGSLKQAMDFFVKNL